MPPIMFNGNLTELDVIRFAIDDLVDYSSMPEGLMIEMGKLEYAGDFFVKTTGREGKRYEAVMYVHGAGQTMDLEIDVYDDGSVEAEWPNGDCSMLYFI